MWQTNLIKLYCAVCDNGSTIESVIQRQSNNFRPQFSDEKCIKAYLWGISLRRFERKTMYEYTRNHLLEWFPKLPSYQAFSDRRNKRRRHFRRWQNTGCTSSGQIYMSTWNVSWILCPIILAKGPRSGHAEVTQELCEKSYNFSRREWYYGLKLHAVVCRRSGRLQIPLSMMASGAAQHALPTAKHILEYHIVLKHGKLYADKAYADTAWAEALKKDYALELLPSRKKCKGDVLISGDTFSTFISSIRQPIECFFNWINRLTNIQSACLFCSLSGLFLYVLARIAAALISLIFNS